jgi:hypothetical protein
MFGFWNFFYGEHIFFFSFSGTEVLNSGFCACETVVLLPEPHLQPFFSGYLGDRISLFCPGQPGPWPSYFKLSAWMTGTSPHPDFFCCWDGVLQIFLPRLAWNRYLPHLSILHSLDDRNVATAPSCWLRWGSLELFAQAGFSLSVLLILASQVGRNTGMSHPCPTTIFICLVLWGVGERPQLQIFGLIVLLRTLSLLFKTVI